MVLLAAPAVSPFVRAELHAQTARLGPHDNLASMPPISRLPHRIKRLGRLYSRIFSLTWSVDMELGSVKNLAYRGVE